MKTIKDVLQQMTDANAIMENLKDVLRNLDPSFPREEEAFRASCDALERSLGDTVTPSPRAYLDAREEELAMELIYIAWQGFMLNRDIFDDPIHALLLGSDHEELHRERRLHTLATTVAARQVQDAFLGQLTEEQRAYTDGITDFYTYLKTSGSKIVHYFGFRLADLFLPYVIPGYTSDEVNTLFYAGELKRYLGLDIERIDDSIR